LPINHKFSCMCADIMKMVKAPNESNLEWRIMIYINSFEIEICIQLQSAYLSSNKIDKCWFKWYINNSNVVMWCSMKMMTLFSLLSVSFYNKSIMRIKDIKKIIHFPSFIHSTTSQVRAICSFSISLVNIICL
jgi:hypothetical protein